MRILNWNTAFVSPGARIGKFERIGALIADYDADVICFTEAFPEATPDGGHTVKSEKSSSSKTESGGGRKVALWSRHGWRQVESLGSPRLPEGRFVSKVAGQQLSDHNGVVIDLDIVDSR